MGCRRRLARRRQRVGRRLVPAGRARIQQARELGGAPRATRSSGRIDPATHRRVVRRSRPPRAARPAGPAHPADRRRRESRGRESRGRGADVDGRPRRPARAHRRERLAPCPTRERAGRRMAGRVRHRACVSAARCGRRCRDRRGRPADLRDHRRHGSDRAGLGDRGTGRAPMAGIDRTVDRAEPARRRTGLRCGCGTDGLGGEPRRRGGLPAGRVRQPVGRVLVPPPRIRIAPHLSVCHAGPAGRAGGGR